MGIGSKILTYRTSYNTESNNRRRLASSGKPPPPTPSDLKPWTWENGTGKFYKKLDIEDAKWREDLPTPHRPWNSVSASDRSHHREVKSGTWSPTHSSPPSPIASTDPHRHRLVVWFRIKPLRSKHTLCEPLKVPPSKPTIRALKTLQYFN